MGRRPRGGRKGELCRHRRRRDTLQPRDRRILCVHLHPRGARGRAHRGGGRGQGGRSADELCRRGADTPVRRRAPGACHGAVVRLGRQLARPADNRRSDSGRVCGFRLVLGAHHSGGGQRKERRRQQAPLGSARKGADNVRVRLLRRGLGDRQRHNGGAERVRVGSKADIHRRGQRVHWGAGRHTAKRGRRPGGGGLRGLDGEGRRLDFHSKVQLCDRQAVQHLGALRRDIDRLHTAADRRACEPRRREHGGHKAGSGRL